MRSPMRARATSYRAARGGKPRGHAARPGPPGSWRVAAAALLALGGCGHAPKGQVVAVVNGQDITERELAAEARAAGRAPAAIPPPPANRCCNR